MHRMESGFHTELALKDVYKQQKEAAFCHRVTALPWTFREGKGEGNGKGDENTESFKCPPKVLNTVS